MKDINNVHCFFEQSGTFKNEFKKIGFSAYDYDIQNDYGQTDFVMDLFLEIEKCFNGGESVFDTIKKEVVGFVIINASKIVRASYGTKYVYLVGNKGEYCQFHSSYNSVIP